MDFVKTGNAYDYHFKSGFGMGLQARYYLTNKTFWVLDMYGKTDNGTYIDEKDPLNVKRTLVFERKDYLITNGLGYDIFTHQKHTFYLHFTLGLGISNGRKSNFSDLGNNAGYTIKTYDFNRATYAICPTIGYDLLLAKWLKIGINYTGSYLGEWDYSQNLNAKFTFIFNQ